MLFLLLLASVVQSCFCGLYPALSASTVEAHGPLARQALDSVATSHSYPSSLLTFTAANVQTPLSPLPAVAPVDVVHHVPSVADVPITKYLDQPGYIQKLVDVPKAKLHVAKLQVRRPAIQKQFYDIEERTIVRPVGSAVVELEEPISKKFITPFTVVSNSLHPVTHFYRPLVYPANSHPFVSYTPFQTPVHNYHPGFVQHIPQFPSASPPQQFPVAPQYPQQPTTTTTQSPQPPQEPSPQRPQYPSFPQPPRPSPDDLPPNSEFDPSDTVVVDNPDFERSRTFNGHLLQQKEENENSFERFEKEFNDLESNNQQELEKERKIQNILDDFESRLHLRALARQGKMLTQQQPNFQVLIKPPVTSLSPEQDYKIYPKEEQLLQRSQETASSEARTSPRISSEAISSSTTTQEQLTAESNIRAAFRSSFDANEDIRAAIAKTHYGTDEVPSRRNLSPEELQDNQQKLIELLTGQGEVSEVALSKADVKLSSVGDSGVVRGRVISVTPAPERQEGEDISEGEERVSTRRVVVSRPVHTLEEVDIHQPFTKLERVTVHEPAVFKTANTHVARVPTTVPVYSRSFAPLFYH